jgi:pyrroline-5-carboxylate reductase
MQLFEASGAAIRVSEDQLDAVTAVSGSGPAYLFYLAEAMEQAAAALDLAEHGRTLAVQTLLGAATLLAASPKTSAAELRKRVTSPGGTTEAALTHMDDRQVRDAIVDAIKAACQRSRELGS